jgi:tetratricopeptide (TPR) repeat protein
LLAVHDLAHQLFEQGKLDEAERLSREGLEIARRVLGEEHGRTLLLMSVLGQALHARKDYVAAESVLVECLELRRRASGYENHLTRNSAIHLVLLYLEQRKFDKAEPLLVERVEFARMHEPENPVLALALGFLGWTRLQQEKFAEAEPVLRECLAFREKRIPDDWPTPLAKWMLGGALLGQKKYAEAEPLLLTGYEGLRQRAATLPPRLRDCPTLALRTLVQLYEAWDKPDEVVKWRKDLEVVEAKTAGKASDEK